MLVVVVVVVALILVASNKSKPAATGESIKIGAALSLSGIAAQDGESIKKGLELAKSDLEKKGVNVEIAYQDDKTEPKDTISAINVLASSGVEAIIGPTWSYLGDAGVPVADRLKVVAVMPANTSEYVTAKSPYAFFTAVKVEKIVPELTKWLKDNNKKNIAIVRNTGGAWYEVVDKAVTEAVANSGGKIVFNEKIVFGSEAEVLPTVVAKLKNVDVDLLFAEIDDDKGVLIMLKKIQEQKNMVDIMSVTTSIGRVLNENNANIKFDNKFYVVAPKASDEFHEKFRAAYNTTPTAYADSAYDSLMLLVDAIQKRGDMPLADYLREKTNYNGLTGRYNFDENGDIEGGSWVIRNLQ